jgi:3D (Asp-Asp-Asp) domain-containing protein
MVVCLFLGDCIMQIAVLILYLLCVISGDECFYVENARVTEYVPELGGQNCEEPCDKTAYMTPVIYGETVACGPDIPYSTRVYIQDVGWRICQDHGGAIDNDEIDVAVPPHEYLVMGYSGYRNVVWVLPDGVQLSEPVGIELRELVGARPNRPAGGATKGMGQPMEKESGPRVSEERERTNVRVR